MRYALEREGWSCVFANDNDPKKREMYEANFPSEDFSPEDIHDLKGADIPSALLATASFPCTDLSLAGARRGLQGAQSGAFWGFTRLLGEMGRRRPSIILLENVPGFLTAHKGQDFRSAVSELNRLGYRCDPFLVDATHFVPQSRLRLFLVAVLNDLQILPPLSEAVLFEQNPVRPPKLAEAINSNRDLLWSLQPFPRPPTHTASLRNVIEDLPDSDGRWWPRERIDHLLSQMKQAHKETVDGLARARTFGYATVYRRMRDNRSMAEVRADGVSGCLRTPRGGSSRQILLKLGRGTINVRYMTAREYARLQGVDDTYKIDVSLNQGLFGFGDAVCVPVIRWIAVNSLSVLAQAAQSRSEAA